MSTTLIPNMMSEEVNTSVEFYCNQLGFRFLAGVPFDSEAVVNEFSVSTALQWAMLGRESAMIMFQARSSLAGEYAPLGEMPLAASATLYIEVGNLDALLDGLGKDVEKVLPDHLTFYGMREVWIRDNNGYLVTLAEKANTQ